MGLFKTFFTVTLGHHLLHVSWFLICDDHWQMTGVLFDPNCSHWGTSCFFSKSGEGLQGDSPGREWVGKAAWNTPCITILAGITQFPSSVRYTTGTFPCICVTSKHTRGKWGGCVASAHNASEHIKCNMEKYLQQESPRDLRKCWDRGHWRSNLLCTLFK